MMARRVSVVLWVIALTGFIPPQAAPRASVVDVAPLAGCLPYDDVVRFLRDQGQEAVAAGLALRGRAVYHVFTREDGGEWTMALTLPDGRTCLLALGMDWTMWRPASWQSL